MPRITEQYAIAVTTKLVATDCANCGVVFAITEELRDRLRTSGNTFYCPNGHSLSYGESEVDRLKRLVKNREESLSFQREMRQGADRRADAAERSLRATKGVVTKMKKRAAAGICPCCSRHFEALHKHMETQHPDYGKEE